jgi:hypothetical protein
METLLLDRSRSEYSVIHILCGETASRDGLQGGESELAFTENLVSSDFHSSPSSTSLLYDVSASFARLLQLFIPTLIISTPTRNFCGPTQLTRFLSHGKSFF